MNKLIGICGAAGVGKSTASDALINLTFMATEVIPFAGPLKDLAVEFFGWDGVKDARGRKLLQTLGTDVGREWDPDFWVSKWKKAVEASLASIIIADDVRFQNEVNAIRDMGGTVVRLRNERGQRLDHSSERVHELRGVINLDTTDMCPEAVAANILRLADRLLGVA